MNRNIVNGNSAPSSRSSKPSSNVKSEKESGYESFQEYPGDSFEKVRFVTARKKIGIYKMSYKHALNTNFYHSSPHLDLLCHLRINILTSMDYPSGK